jgi:hypothetical protein
LVSNNLNGSVGGGDLVRVDPNAELAACDELPAALRVLIKGSFINTRASTVLEQWREVEARGAPLGLYVDWFAKLLMRNQARSCEATYGAEHPQSHLPDPSPPITVARRDHEDDASLARAARRAAEIKLDSV